MAAGITELELDINSEDSISVAHHQADSSSLILWLPSERGLAEGSNPIANNVADLGIDVWMVDLHNSLMVSPGRNSLNLIPVANLVQLVDIAKERGFKQIYLMSAGRGVQLALNAIYQYSSLYPESNLLRGSVLFNPNLFRPVSLVGEAAEFVEGSDTSHLPVYLIQAEFSTKYVYTRQIRDQLERGGSPVFTHVLPEVESGFAFRSKQGLSEASLNARQQLPGIIINAIRLLSKQPGVVFQRVKRAREISQITKQAPMTALRAFEKNKAAPALSLYNLEGDRIDLKDYRGRVVLVDFWASWCKPCVDEMPSLARLSQLYDKSQFTVLTVNSGESRQRVDDFLQGFNHKFDVMLDENGIAVRDWRVYVYPSNYLIDKSGFIRYGYSGPLEWDSREILSLIETLLTNPDRAGFF